MAMDNVLHELHEIHGLFMLTILDSGGDGVTGQTPQVQIQRRSDGFWADFFDFSFTDGARVTPFGDMVEVDAVNAPGVYVYDFDRDAWSESGNEESYLVAFSNTTVPYEGVASELHRWYDLTSEGLNVGQYQVVIYVKDEHGAAIVGVDVDVWTGLIDSPTSVRYARKTTVGNGGAVFFLDAGTYKVYLSDPTHTSFTYPETVVVTTNQTNTLFGTTFDPGSVPANTVRIYSWEHMADGRTPVEGAKVYAWPTEEGQSTAWGGVGARTRKMTALTDANGYWYLDLVPGLDYVFDVQSTRSKLWDRVTTPTSGNSQFEDLLDE